MPTLFRAAAARQPRVVIAHDYLTQRGGAERVVLAMLDAFPQARVVTTIYHPSTPSPEFRRHRVESLWPAGPPGCPAAWGAGGWGGTP